MIGSRAFSLDLLLTNPGDPAPHAIRGDLFRRGRNTDPGMDNEGTLVTDWVLLVPPTEAIQPLAEVQSVDTGVLYWVHGVPDPHRSLLRGTLDHIEARLKTVYRYPTVVDILRDGDATDFNDLGDPIGTPTVPPERTAVPASVVQRSEIVPTDTDLRTVSSWVGWVPVGTDVRRDDTLRTPDGVHYRVDGITVPIHVGLRELRLDLTRSSAADGGFLPPPVTP